MGRKKKRRGTVDLPGNGWFSLCGEPFTLERKPVAVSVTFHYAGCGHAYGMRLPLRPDPGGGWSVIAESVCPEGKCPDCDPSNTPVVDPERNMDDAR
jgi:hypothetical protein